jgi:hypothetical protein
MSVTHVPPVTNTAKVLQKSKIFGAMGNTKIKLKIIIGIKIEWRKCNTLIQYLISNTS